MNLGPVHAKVNAAQAALAEEFADDDRVRVTRGVPGPLTDAVDVNVAVSLTRVAIGVQTMDDELARPTISFYIQCRQNEVDEQTLYTDYWTRGMAKLAGLGLLLDDEGAQLDIAQIKNSVYTIIATDLTALTI